MELHLQFGFGMMEHCRHLLTEWGSGTVVLSPRDLTPKSKNAWRPGNNPRPSTGAARWPSTPPRFVLLPGGR